MINRKVPKRLWDYGIRWVCEVMRLTSNTARTLHARTPLEQVTGETPDISEYLDFSFYDYVWYFDNAGVGGKLFGRWLGVLHQVGSQMCFFVIKPNGKVERCTSVQPVMNIELKLMT